ncbi:hypothetical protein [Ruegeria marina]|uniref:Uncharacterized protein n=1 Tax=Ruegeria marina TaxID=639004 RepID=A0A1G6JF78_9RHOB|nr:hypothetical protein [Ruegeria marina]SDC17350.1 hypothetical protein SAMN04488239_101345 [Ruegeria marina]
MPTRLAVFLLVLPGLALAQSQPPLSVIDWLNAPPPANLPGTVLLEPPVTRTGQQPQIEVTPLEALSPPLGLVSSGVTGLPVDLWQRSDAEQLAESLMNVPVRDHPAMQTLLYTLLLSETRPPQGAAEASERMLLARIDRLMQLGAVDPAQALVQLAGPTDTSERFARWFNATLLTGDEDRSCAALVAKPYLSPDYAARIFCTARRGDWTSAALTLEAAHVLDLIPQDTLNLLDRFLSPEIFEDLPPPVRPTRPDPLTFRLFEAIGEPMATAPLPRAYANADLRDLAGWKAQLEAAERLTRIGALTPNQLLGLYTQREPAASGGIWDRVTALQRFETALQAGSPEAVAKTLPIVWQAMQQARLEVPFAHLFADALAQLTLTDPKAAALAWRIRLLSPAYELAAREPVGTDSEAGFLAALAQGTPGNVLPPSPRAAAIAEGFSRVARLAPELELLLDDGHLGEAILEAMDRFARGAQGNHGDLAMALALFRRVGLEDTARRAALQLMLLDRS